MDSDRGGAQGLRAVPHNITTHPALSDSTGSGSQGCRVRLCFAFAKAFGQVL